MIGASNNHNDSFPSFASFCALHHFWKLQSALPWYLPLCFLFPRQVLLGSPCLSCSGGKGRQGNVLLWGGARGRGRGGASWHPVPSFPLRREILAQGGSLLVSVYLVLVVLATFFCWPTYPSLYGRGGAEGSKAEKSSMVNFVFQIYDFRLPISHIGVCYTNTTQKGGCTWHSRRGLI